MSKRDGLDWYTTYGVGKRVVKHEPKKRFSISRLSAENKFRAAVAVTAFVIFVYALFVWVHDSGIFQTYHAKSVQAYNYRCSMGYNQQEEI